MKLSNLGTNQKLAAVAVILGLVSVALLLVLVALRDEIGRLFDIIREEIRSRPGLGQGAGCPSVGGCKPRDGG